MTTPASAALPQQTALSELRWLEGYKLPEALAVAVESWPFLPYVRETGDIKRCARQYLADLIRLSGPESGSLCLAAQRGKSGLWIAGIRKLDWDSDLFGFGVGALEPLASPVAAAIDAVDVACGAEIVGASLKEAKRRELKQVSAQVDCQDTLSHMALQAAGFRLMDTVVGFHLKLSKSLPFDAAAHYPQVRPMRDSDVEPLAEISAECFGNRRHNINRFNSDHNFPQDKVRELYAQWIRNSFQGTAADGVLVYETDGKPVGFITMKLPTAAERELGVNLGKIPLNAVHPDYHGRGFYTAMVKAALDWFRQQRLETVEIRTQLPNYAVHRAWENLGAHLVLAYHRFHVNLTN